jgi:hypothetical protein
MPALILFYLMLDSPYYTQTYAGIMVRKVETVLSSCTVMSLDATCSILPLIFPESAEPVRQIEVWLDDAHWLLTQDDGQLQMADIRFTNFR